LLSAYLPFVFTMESKNDLIDGIKIDRVYVDGKKTELEAHRSKQREITEKSNP